MGEEAVGMSRRLSGSEVRWLVVVGRGVEVGGRNVWVAMMVCAGAGWKTRVAVARARGLSIVHLRVRSRRVYDKPPHS